MPLKFTEAALNSIADTGGRAIGIKIKKNTYKNIKKYVLISI